MNVNHCCKKFISFNPYHLGHGSAYWLSLFIISIITVFFPSVVLMLWLTEVFDSDFVISTTFFGVIVLIFIFLNNRGDVKNMEIIIRP